MRPDFSRPLIGLAWLAGLAGAWVLVALLFRPPPEVLPSPLAVALELVDFTDARGNWFSLAAGTLGPAVLGWLAGGLAGVIAGSWLAGAGRAMQQLWLAVCGLARLAGVAAVPLLLGWSGYGPAAKLLLAGGLAFFPVATASLAAVRAVPPVWREVMRGFSASRAETWLSLELPAALPAVAAALRHAWGFALAGVVVAEFLGVPGGLGGQILQHAAALDLAGAVAGVIVLAGLAGAVELLLYLAEQAAGAWAGGTAPEGHTDPRKW